MRVANILLVLTFSLTASPVVFADTRPNPVPKRTHEETISTMKLGKYLRCSFAQDYLLQTKEGGSTPDNDLYTKRVLFQNIAPEASSPSDFATYSLEWENQEFSFYFYMNSQVGEIRIADKEKGISAETRLDLSDFAKQEPYVGAVKLVQREDILVSDPRDPSRKLPGERLTYLEGSCQFLQNFVP